MADPAHLPRWSEYITAIRPDGDAWLATTTQGEVRMKFAPRNAFGILDHDVTINPALTVHVPLRVVRNDEGAEVLFTIFRLDGMSDAGFERDIGMVRTDLEKLRGLFGANGGGRMCRQQQ